MEEKFNPNIFHVNLLVFRSVDFPGSTLGKGVVHLYFDCWS